MKTDSRHIVIGATGVAGTAAIRAIRHRFGDRADITAVWFGRPEDPPPGADRAVVADVTAPDFVETLRREAGESFDFLFFATARGEVGFPVRDATTEQVAEADRYSFTPLLRLEAGLSVTTLVAYSTFYLLEHQLINYGAMGFSKEKIEKWVLDAPRGRRVCIRAGAFRSASSKAIKLMLRRRAKILARAEDPLLRSFFEGRKPSEAVDRLEQAVLDEEKARFGDTGTDGESLFQAHLAVFEHPGARFVNVAGRKIWLSEEPQLLGE